MSYITATNLLNHLGKSELALLVQGKLDATIDAELLALMIIGGDISAYQTTQVTETTEALALINNTISSVINIVNGYMPKRYQLPLTSDVVLSSPLPLICVKLANYELSLAPSEQMINDKKDALQQLRDIAKGMILLGGDDPQKTTSQTVRVSRCSSCSITHGFGR